MVTLPFILKGIPFALNYLRYQFNDSKNAKFVDKLVF